MFHQDFKEFLKGYLVVFCIAVAALALWSLFKLWVWFTT